VEKIFKKETEGSMISFRADDSTTQLLSHAQSVTGRSRTDLLLTLVREFLPTVARRYIAEHERELAQARQAFTLAEQHHAASTPPAKPGPHHPGKPVSYHNSKPKHPKKP